MKIGPIDLASDVLVVAEIGNNHEGDVELAEELVCRAAAAGAQAVKFQTIRPELLVSSADAARLAQLRRFALREADFQRLADVARRQGVMFISTPFHLGAVHFLDPLVPAFKVASGDVDFLPLLDAIAATGKPVLLSTGASDLAVVARSTDFLDKAWRKHKRRGDLVLLHCVVSYPTPAASANLNAITALKQLSPWVGYSDHTMGIEAAVLSVALGARVIEKHFTIDKNHSDFRDHKLSADPEELAELVRRVREAVAMLGDGVKRVLDCEQATVGLVRRAIAAGRDLAEGSAIAATDLVWLRPRAQGLAPGSEERLIGRRLRRAVAAGQPILPEDVA